MSNKHSRVTIVDARVTLDQVTTLTGVKIFIKETINFQLARTPKKERGIAKAQSHPYCSRSCLITLKQMMVFNEFLNKSGKENETDTENERQFRLNTYNPQASNSD